MRPQREAFCPRTASPSQAASRITQLPACISSRTFHHTNCLPEYQDATLFTQTDCWTTRPPCFFLQTASLHFKPHFSSYKLSAELPWRQLFRQPFSLTKSRLSLLQTVRQLSQQPFSLTKSRPFSFTNCPPAFQAARFFLQSVS